MADASFQPGEVVFAAEDLYNDGSIPDVADGALMAAAGTRGVVVKSGHIEAAPEVDVYVVRFEGDDAVLGSPVGCLAHELTQQVSALNAAHA